MVRRERLCIVGFGRFGQTIAGILDSKFDIAVLDIDESKQKRAKKLGYSVIGDSQVKHYETVLFAVPISSFEGTTRDLADHISPGTLVMDACSVKVYPTEIMKKAFKNNVSIIATHPLFGPDSIKRGPDNLTIVAWPVRAKAEQYQEWNEIWRSIGFRVLETSPEEHDKATAYTLGMTHFFGRIMGELKLRPEQITTVGYDALYEVMKQTNSDTWQLFHDMQHYNPYAKEMRDEVYRAIQKLESELDLAIKVD